ncbi:S41 family peptidase [Candidatus Gracilibacteria bacterium]|nr:S41 family peptidase [Candidatus Gracilibacteria bacterium]
MKQKKFFALILFGSILGNVFSTFSTVEAYRDLSPSSSIYPAVQNLINRGVLEDGAFFRADTPVPAQMFWEVLLRDAGFDPHSATFDTPLPPNIRDSDPIAQFLREAGRRGFINLEEDFDKEAILSRAEAVELFVTTKGILPPRTVSNVFLRKTSGVPPREPEYLKFFEAAYASHVLEDLDINPVRPHDTLTRRDLVRWIYNYETKGEKISTLNPRGAQAFSQNARTRRPTNDKDTSPSPTQNAPAVIRIQTLDSGALTEVREVGQGLQIPDGRIVEEVFRRLANEYRFPEDLTEEKKREMVNAGIAAMVRKMGDKYSSYIEPANAQDFQDELNGQYEGIGAYVEMNAKEEFMITSPITGSPAEKAGVMPGDIVTQVDGYDISGESVTDIIHRIKGPAGTQVTLTISRGEESLEITITRGEIEVPSITLKWERDIPVIGLHKFTKETKDDLEKILIEEVLPKNPRGMVFDLRNNPGGFLTSAVEVGELFLKEGDVIFSVDYSDRTQDFKSSQKGLLYGRRNIVFLQNKGSASASEILTGMVQDYNIGPIIGETSVGKGTVQNVSPMSNGATLKLTIAKWLTPKSRWIQSGEKEEDHGVKPDIEVVSPTPKQKQEGVDPQLDVAVQYVLTH